MTLTSSNLSPVNGFKAIAVNGTNDKLFTGAGDINAENIPLPAGAPPVPNAGEVLLVDTNDTLVGSPYTGTSAIQNAINAASNNYKIIIGEGTYNGFTVPGTVTGLTISGPNSGTSGDGTRQNEAVITTTSTISGANTTLSGVRVAIDGSTSPGNTTNGQGILVYGANVIIEDSVFYRAGGTSNDRWAAVRVQATNTTVQDNLITMPSLGGFSGASAGWHQGIYGDVSVSSNMQILGNVIQNARTAIAADYFSNQTLIDNNSVSGSGTGIAIGSPSSTGFDYATVITNNDLDIVSGGTSVNLQNLTSGVTFTTGTNTGSIAGVEGLNLLGTPLGTDSLTGGTGNDIINGRALGDTLDGSTGNDTVSYANSSTGVTVNLQTNTTSGGDAAGDVLSNFENIIGSNSADSLTGDGQNNSLFGLGGDDTLDGGSGNDTLDGGSGNDTYIIDSSIDVINESITVTTEIDTVQSGVSYTLGNNLENLVLTGTSNIDGTGNSLNNSITGNSGNNILDGGTGNDILTGGLGNDTYIVDSTLDLISETSTLTSEIDTVQASFTYTLSANLENLVLTGSSNIDGVGNNLNNEITGNIGDNIIDGGVGADTLDGGDGNDTVTYANSTAAVSVNLQTSTASGGDATGDAISNIENVIGTGFNDSLTGNDQENSLVGGAGNDSLDGGSADDTLTGGTGNDTYYVDSTLDVISETSTVTTEIDTVFASETYLLSANLDNLTLTGSNNIEGIGNNRDNNIVGNGGDNILTGAAGNDTLTGNNGTDTLRGGAGNDLYIISDTSDVIQETVTITTQIDTVQSSVSYSLSNNLENLTLTGTSTTIGEGNSLNNTITGNSGNNALDGGTGADTLTGGLGNDIYGVDNVGDVVNETSTITTELDAVISYITYTLGANVEYLQLEGTSNINGVGNSLNNIILGNDGNNTLDGLAGNDSLAGGLGNDTYFVDSSNDEVSEDSTLATEIDTVQSGVTYTLGNNLENLVLTGSGNTNGVGNSSDNSITGNSGDNSLDGGTGNDTLTGGLGNDTYFVDSSNDVINESSTLATEIDTVNAIITYTLSANLENLVLFGASNLNGVGNSLNNSITGNSGDNTLDGQAGNDTLTGGLGNDTYIVDSSTDIVSETSTITTEIDNVQSSATYTLSANLENLTLTGSSNIDGVGNSLDNTITANSGNNNLTGGLGNDTYIVDSSNDVINETSTLATEIDTVQSSATYTLGSNLENLVLTGTSNLDGVGNSLNNSLTGNSGNNTLDGQAGNDTLTGGLGNDTYIVDSSTDVISETSTIVTEIDNVQSTATYTLSANLENLTLVGSSNLEGVGNDLGNIITANSGNNVIRGGKGNDSLIGNVGNDYLGGGDQDDSLVGGQGNDSLYGGFDNDSISGGDGNDLLSGDAGKDSIEGGLGNDYVDGGAWYDTMVGGVGNDTYIVDSFSDVINETTTISTEIDEVRNSADFSLSANLENLILQGTANIFGQGNSQQNTITGNTGDNFLTGGDGADTLTGNNGNDRMKGDIGSDSLTGGNGNDTLTGYGGSNERDTLVGGAGNDVFYLGDATTIFYDLDDNAGYGLITDLDAGDKIQLKATSSNYELVKVLNIVGTSAKDTIIATTDGDIIGVVQDNTSLIASLSSSVFIYAS